MTADVRRRLKAGAVAMLSAMIAGLSTPSISAAQAASAPTAPPDAANGQPTTASALTVVAPRLLRGGPGPAWASGARIGVVSLAQNASFADLDLTTQGGADEFKRRVMYAALDACNQLEAKYPSTVYIPVQANESCPDTTAASALIVAEQIIATARAHPK
jgi:UrcA family protein